MRGICKETSQAPSKLNTQAFRYVPCNTSRSRRCAKTFRKEASEKHLYDGNPGSYRQAMTIAARIMILLYGAGGEPSGGEIPMNSKPIERLMTSHSVWGLRTNNTHDFQKHRLGIVGATFRKRSHKNKQKTKGKQNQHEIRKNHFHHQPKGRRR